MSASLTRQVLIVVTSPPALESQLIDWLLTEDGGAGFSSSVIHGHSTRHDHLSIAEQVSGRQRRIQFQIQLEATRQNAFVDALRESFAGADLHYWIVPVLAGGHLRMD